MTKQYQIAPSILSANFASLGDDINAVIKAGADLVHVDVMDNHYVPNLTFGPLICSAIKNHGITTPLDVHLMIKPVDPIIPEFAKAGASIITIHPESTDHLDRTLNLIHDANCKAGIAFNPGTPLTILEHVIDKCDLILIMSVNPGFSGQSFIPSALEKCRQARKLIDASGRDIHLQIDGGVNLSNIREIFDTGVDTFVMGSAIFNTNNYVSTFNSIDSALSQ